MQIGYLNLWNIFRFIFRQLRMTFFHKFWLPWPPSRGGNQNLHHPPPQFEKGGERWGVWTMTIDDAVTYASVVNEEVWWALVCVVVGYSSNSSRPMSGLFPVMFSDSPNDCSKVSAWAWQVELFNLVWLFKGKLMHDVQNSNYYSLGWWIT